MKYSHFLFKMNQMESKWDLTYSSITNTWIVMIKMYISLSESTTIFKNQFLKGKNNQIKITQKR